MPERQAGHHNRSSSGLLVWASGGYKACMSSDAFFGRCIKKVDGLCIGQQVKGIACGDADPFAEQADYLLPSKTHVHKGF